MAATNTIKKFAENVIELLKKFAGEQSTATPTSETVQDLQIFIKPLTGRKGAELGIVHARYEKREKDREVIMEYRMRAPEINMVDANLHKAVEQAAHLETAIRHEMKREVLMRLFQASVAQGKASGRTGDRAIIAALSDHDVPLYFAKQSNDYKKQITEDTEFPFTKGYIVDVSVEYEGERMKSYTLVHLHKVIEL
jgi:archaellin